MATELWIPLIVGGIAIIVLLAVVGHVTEQNRRRRMRVIATTNVFTQESWSTIDAIPSQFLPRELRVVLASRATKRHARSSSARWSAKPTDARAVIEIARLERRAQALEAKVAEQQAERQKEFDAALDKDNPRNPERASGGSKGLIYDRDFRFAAPLREADVRSSSARPTQWRAK